MPHHWWQPRCRHMECVLGRSCDSSLIRQTVKLDLNFALSPRNTVFSATSWPSLSLFLFSEGLCFFLLSPLFIQVLGYETGGREIIPYILQKRKGYFRVFRELVSVTSVGVEKKPWGLSEALWPYTAVLPMLLHIYAIWIDCSVTKQWCSAEGTDGCHSGKQYTSVP